MSHNIYLFILFRRCFNISKACKWVETEAFICLDFKEAFEQFFLQNLIFLMLWVSDRGGYLTGVYLDIHVSSK